MSVFTQITDFTHMSRVGPRNTFFPKKNYFTKGPPGDEIDIETRVLVPF